MAKANGNQLAAPTLSEETIRSLVANQATELQLRSEELAVHKESLSHNRDLAIESISAQKGDRADARNHERSMQKNRFVFCGLVVLFALVAVCVLAFFDKDGLAQKCIEVAAYVGCGAFGGYAFGRHKRVGDDAREDNEN
jgi:hypothetical protein